jgi:hypothetical protein
MGYAIELSERALEQIRALPLPVQRYIARELDRLASSPSQWSKPAAPLHPPGQLFEVELAHQGLDWYIDVIFVYDREEVLLVTDVSAEYV